MIATPRARIAVPFARRTSLPAPPALPATAIACGHLWGVVVLEAVLALRNQLTSPNETLVAAAANSILELERTRMRHNQRVSGTRVAEYADEEEAGPDPEPGPVSAPEELADHVAEIRAHMAEVVRRPMTEAEGVAYVAEKFARWRVDPKRVHRGEFLAMLRGMNELPGGAPSPA